MQSMTSNNVLRDWFKKGVLKNADYMLICDTFNVGHFPIYVDHASSVRATVNRYNDTPMTRVTEVYDLKAPMEEQIFQEATWRMPPTLNVQLPAVFQARRSQERRMLNISVLHERRVHHERRSQSI
jgi:hypothetical protein